MQPLRSAVLAVVLATTLAAPQQAEARPGDPVAGQRYAETWCSGCHAVELRTTRSGGIAPDFPTIANRRKTTARWLDGFLRRKHDRMPDFEIEPRDAADVIALILSLKRK